ncbi:hypothetical protein C8R45DRAFT_964933 [Mycena sanguinolenta]|nr:hypothetical protein C8R45DRAFT_964933 [Mycena sanguinolenta]
MSTDELRARIRELDTKIHFHKELLKQLQNDKSLLQRQLNAVHDPIARLPLEISSKIFLQSLPPLPTPGPSHPPMLLLNVCSTWSAIALSSPDLWTAIQIEFPCSNDVAQLLRIWFQRTRNRPVSVLLCGALDQWNHVVSAVIWRHGPQLKHVEISDDCDDAEGDFHSNRAIDLFNGTMPDTLPLLERLTIRCPRRECFTNQILEFLRLAPNIIECYLGSQCHVHESDFTGDELGLATLRRLTFGERRNWDNCDDAVLTPLSLPALETLAVPMCFVSDAGLLRFMKRSTPPLEELTMAWQDGATSIHLDECLRLIPTLATFKMWGPEPQTVAHLLSSLADSPSFLPNLHTLMIDMRTNWMSGTTISIATWQAFVRALSTRRFQFHLLAQFLEAPPQTIVAALLELVDDGVEIHIIGQNNHDFISHGSL